MNKKFKITSFIFYIAISFFILFIALFSVLSLIQGSYMQFNNLSHRMVYRNLFTLGSLIVFIILITACILISKYGNKISSKKVLAIEMIIFAIVGIIYCLAYEKINIVGDSLDVYNAAYGITHGNFNAIDSKTYIGKYPSNLGLLTEYYLFINIFGDGMFILKYMRLINILVAIIGYIYLYKITDILYRNNKVNLYLLLLFLGFNHLLLYSSFVYTNVIGYSLSIISIYYLIYYLKTGKRLWISFFCIVLSILIRKNSLIILIAEIIILLMNVIEKKKLINILFVLIFSLGLLTPKLIIKYYENKYNVVYDHQLPTNVFIYYGLNYTNDTPGGYFPDFDFMFEEYEYNKDSLNDYGKTYVNNTLTYFKNNPLKCVEFYTRKFISAWCDHNYDVFSDQSNETTPLIKYEPIMNDIYDGFLSLMAIGLVIYVLGNRNNISYELILIISVVGGFLFHSFWEIRAIYTYQYILLLLPLSACGLKIIYDNLVNVIK